MIKKLVYGFAVIAGLASCNDDYTDWAAPQSNEPNAPVDKIAFTVQPTVSSIDFVTETAESIQLFTADVQDGKVSEYTLTLSLDAVENCLVGPAEYQYVTIQVTDRISCPVWWSQSSAANLGVYSDMKYRVFIIFMDGEILESLDKYTGIEFVNLIADFKAWWKDQWQQGNYQYYDTDGVTPLYETILDN